MKEGKWINPIAGNRPPAPPCQYGESKKDLQYIKQIDNKLYLYRCTICGKVYALCNAPNKLLDERKGFKGAITLKENKTAINEREALLKEVQWNSVVQSIKRKCKHITIIEAWILYKNFGEVAAELVQALDKINFNFRKINNVNLDKVFTEDKETRDTVSKVLHNSKKIIN